jgi:hypothetical protein
LPYTSTAPENGGITTLPYTPSFGSLTPCSVPHPPTAPYQPAYPVYGVVPQWEAEAESAQEEAAAVWEALHHRAGGYTQFFDVPKTYKPDGPHFADPAKQLEDMANKLH